MQGLMMDEPLMISSLLKFAATNYPEKGVTSREVDGSTARLTYPEIERRSRQLVRWLLKNKVHNDSVVGTIAWNSHRHLELYYGVSGAGAVCHTINPRLSIEEIAFVLKDAGTEIVFFDASFLPIIEALSVLETPVKIWVQMAAKGAEIEGYPNYETLLEQTAPLKTWPLFEEGRAAGLCYTSGTTGRPKGVLYSHRSTVLHAMACAAPNVLDVKESDRVLPVVPMFHVNAWGLPHIAPMAGADLIFPGAALDGKSLAQLIETENVTFAAGVPTIWHGLIKYLQESGAVLGALERCIVGGAALPEAMIRYFEDVHGCAMFQGWGMTETSPICSISKLTGADTSLSRDEQVEIKARQGAAVFPIQMKILSADGTEALRDDKTSGELYVKGPWVAKTYVGQDQNTALQDGWFPTGDIAKISPAGSMKITDRAKDIIKSGGEWISSIEIEDAAMSHPGVAQAAVIGIPDPRWDERPLVVFVPTQDDPADSESLREHLSSRLPKWKIPESYKALNALPLGATGKVLKTELRLRLLEGDSA